MIKRPQGYATLTDKITGKVTKQFDTLTCAHCNKVYCSATDSRIGVADPGGRCKICGGFICSPCVGTLIRDGCFPFEKKLDWYEKGRWKEMMEKGVSLQTGGYPNGN